MELRFSLRPQRLIHRLENVLSPSAGFQIIQDRSNVVFTNMIKSYMSQVMCFIPVLFRFSFVTRRGGLSRRQPMDGWAMDIYETLSNFNEIVTTANLTPSVAL